MKEMRENLKKNVEKNAKYPPGQGFWAVEEKVQKRIVGAALLKPLPDNAMNLTADIEVGWHLRRDAWGKGFATEFARALLMYGFEELKLPEIYALISPENLPSIKVAERLNLKALGMSEKYVGLKAELFRMTAAEWIAQPSK
jgi:RimJ/RimL family protein N-acetyltransferase